MTIDTGAGNDTVYNWGGNNISIGTGDGNDSVYFQVGSTSKAITLSDFTATSFNVNGTDYKIKGSKLVKK